MNIFESLENLNVSEECFEDIIGLVEELLDKGVASKYRGFNSTMTQERSKEIADSIQNEIKRDEAKVAKKPNKAATKRILNNQKWLEAHKKFQQSGKRTPFEGGKIGEL